MFVTTACVDSGLFNHFNVQRGGNVPTDGNATVLIKSINHIWNAIYLNYTYYGRKM